MKKIYLFGNWKMNGVAKDLAPFADGVSQAVKQNPDLARNTEFCIFPSFVLIPEAVRCFEDTPVAVGSQNVSEYAPGAYTGEVSPEMLTEAGVHYAIIGHSERRHIYGETSEQVHQKALNCLSHSLVPVICVGETLEERDAGKAYEVILEQLTTAIKDFPADAKYLIAYEPVWAIGTGRAASAADAEDICAFIKKYAASPVLYGGSVKPSNSAELFTQKSIDGGLIGGAALKVSDYLGILNNFRAAEVWS